MKHEEDPSSWSEEGVVLSSPPSLRLEVAECLLSFYRAGVHCDAEIICGSGDDHPTSVASIPCHRVVLATAVSGPLREALAEDAERRQDQGRSVLLLPDHRFEVVAAFLDVLYGESDRILDAE